MEYVSIEKSRSGWQPGDSPNTANEPTPATSTDPVAKTNNGGKSVSKSEED